MNKKQEEAFLGDYLNALRKPTQAISDLLSEEMRSAEETFDYKQVKSMEVIEEEETDREGEEELPRTARIKKEFNQEIRNLFKIKSRLQEIVNLYKVEIKSMAETIIAIKEEHRHDRNKSEQEDRSRKKDVLQASRKSSKGRLKQEEKEEELKIRKAPEPVKSECLNCLKLEQQRLKMQEDRHKWKLLSQKIEDFKKKHSVFEVELKQKDAEIKVKQEEIHLLKTKVGQLEKNQNSDREEDEKKKLKKDNTSLRGQKVLLTNQLASLRKQIAEKSQIADVQDIEIKKLRLEIDNLNSSLNWHVSNLNQLRNSHKRGLSQEQRQQTERAEGLIKLNRTMARTIQEQQQLLQTVNNKIKRLQDGWTRETERYEKKLSEMESILQDKNETIIKLKNSSKGDKKSSYHADMIKVLNKKLAEKEEQIRSLQDRLEAASQ